MASSYTATRAAPSRTIEATPARLPMPNDPEPHACSDEAPPSELDVVAAALAEVDVLLLPLPTRAES